MIPNSNESPLWVGPGSDDAFLKAIQRTKLVPGIPQSIEVEGWPTTFRVVARHENGRTIYLGLSNRGARYLLRSLTRRFPVAVGLHGPHGFSDLVHERPSHPAPRSTHYRHCRANWQRGLGERLPQPVNSDEISRLAKTFNHMLDRIQSSVNELRSVTDAVAHDLKSPVTSIRGALESVLSE